MSLPPTSPAHEDPAILPAWRRPLPVVLADLLVLLVLLGAGLVFTHGLPHYADVSLWDEASYLERGLHLTRDGLPVAQYAPLYSVYYWLLSLVIADPVQIALANQMLTAIALPLAFYVLLRAARVPLGAAWAVAAFALLSYVNLHLDLKVAHAALILLMLFCAAALRAATLAGAARWILAGTLLAAYVRPEYFLAFILLLPVWLVGEGRNFRARGWKRAAGPAGLTAAAIVLTLGSLGFPAFVGGQGREMLAFSQHFAIRWVQWHYSDLNPGYDYAVIIEQAFGRVTSPLQALLANPAIFFRHVGENILGLVTQGPKIFLLHFQLPAWTGGARLKPWDGMALLAAIAVGAVFAHRRYRSEPRPASRNWLLLVLLVPAAISGTLIFPKYYYIMPLVFFGAAFALGWLHARTPATRVMPGLLLLGAVLQLALTPTLASTEFTRRQRPVRAVIDDLRSRQLHGSLNILEDDGGYNVFLGPDARMVRHFEKKDGFDAFRRENDINVIVADDYLERQDVRFRDDPEWRRFLQDPGAQGFVRSEVPSTARRLYIRRDLLPAAPR
jgi:hypothetical protein